MKRLAVFVFALVMMVSLTACNSKKEKVELSFEDAYTTFINTHASNVDTESIANTLQGTWESKATTTLITDNTQTGINITIENEGISDQDNVVSSGTSTIDAKVYMNDEEYKIKTDIQVFQSLSGNKITQYLKIADLDVSLGSGNVQEGFIKTLAEPILGNWLQIDILDQLQKWADTTIQNMNPVDDWKKIITNILNIPNVLKENRLLENLGQTTYESDLAYKVKLDPQSVKNIIKSLLSGTSAISGTDMSDIEKLDIQWLLVVRDTDEIELLINNINGDTKGTLLFADKEVVLTYISEEWAKVIVKVQEKSVSKYKVIFTIQSEDKNTQESLHVDWTVDIQTVFSSDHQNIKITWKVSIKTPQLANVLGNSELVLNFSLDSESRKMESITLTAPDSAILLSQLLSDNFGLPYMQQNAQPNNIWENSALLKDGDLIWLEDTLEVQETEE